MKTKAKKGQAPVIDVTKSVSKLSFLSFLSIFIKDYKKVSFILI